MLQSIRGGEDQDALIRVQVEQVFIAGDDERGASGERAGNDVIIPDRD